MSAYASTRARVQALPAASDQGRLDAGGGDHLIESLIAQLADRVATVVLARLDAGDGADADWLDSRHAADYLGVHRDTLRKLAAERAIPSEQDGPGCKLFFRRADLDVWRRSGGRPRHLAALTSRAA